MSKLSKKGKPNGDDLVSRTFELTEEEQREIGQKFLIINERAFPLPIWSDCSISYLKDHLLGNFVKKIFNYRKNIQTEIKVTFKSNEDKSNVEFIRKSIITSKVTFGYSTCPMELYISKLTSGYLLRKTEQTEKPGVPDIQNEIALAKQQANILDTYDFQAEFTIMLNNPSKYTVKDFFNMFNQFPFFKETGLLFVCQHSYNTWTNHTDYDSPHTEHTWHYRAISLFTWAVANSMSKIVDELFNLYPHVYITCLNYWITSFQIDMAIINDKLTEHDIARAYRALLLHGKVNPLHPVDFGTHSTFNIEPFPRICQHNLISLLTYLMWKLDNEFDYLPVLNFVNERLGKNTFTDRFAKLLTLPPQQVMMDSLYTTLLSHCQHNVEFPVNLSTFLYDNTAVTDFYVRALTLHLHFNKQTCCFHMFKTIADWSEIQIIDNITKRKHIETLLVRVFQLCQKEYLTVKDFDGRSILHHAVHMGIFPVVQAIVSRNAEINDVL